MFQKSEILRRIMCFILKQHNKNINRYRAIKIDKRVEDFYLCNIGSGFPRRFGNHRLHRHDSSRKTRGEKNRMKGKEENCATMPAMPRTFDVYQSRGCRIREKRAELTVERVYVKSSTVIDSLPSSTLLRVDHEGWRAGWYARVV